MITDLNSKVDFSNKPFDIQRNGIAIYALSDKGVNDYVSNNHFTHHYLNKYPKEILGMIDNYAEEKDEINNKSNPYPVKEKKEPEQSNAKPIPMKLSHKEENNEKTQPSLKKESQAKTQQKKTSINDNKIKQPSNSFKNYSQQIMKCVNSPGNEMYTTASYKKEMEKFGKQTVNRYNTKISSSK